jgi:NADPH-dependent curcumin reductase
MDSKVNRRIVVAERPRYAVPTANVFKLETAPKPKPADGELLIRTTWLGLDPYLYGRVKRISNQAEPVPLGSVMVGPTVGRVEVSYRPDFNEGDLVEGFWGWQDYAISDGTRIARLDPDLQQPSHALGALGISGFGAWLAVDRLVKVQPGETLTFGAACGGLGSMVGQIGKLRGARVIGVAGGPEKCRFAVEKLGFDACINRHAEDYETELRAEYARNGVHCYVMAIGGRMFELAMPYFHLHARVAVCGLMASYSMQSLPDGPDRTMVLLNEINLRRMQLSGLVTLDYLGTPEQEQFRREMKAWIREGKVKPLEHVVEGLENTPDMMQGLFEGRNFGKAVVHVAD